MMWGMADSGCALLAWMQFPVRPVWVISGIGRLSTQNCFIAAEKHNTALQLGESEQMKQCKQELSKCENAAKAEMSTES